MTKAKNLAIPFLTLVFLLLPISGALVAQSALYSVFRGIWGYDNKAKDGERSRVVLDFRDDNSLAMYMSEVAEEPFKYDLMQFSIQSSTTNEISARLLEFVTIVPSTGEWIPNPSGDPLELTFHLRLINRNRIRLIFMIPYVGLLLPVDIFCDRISKFEPKSKLQGE